jgi:hypothetical protein
MRLLELDPKWAHGASSHATTEESLAVESSEKFLIINCPKHPAHRLAIRVGPQARSFQDGDVTRHVWRMTGSTFDDLTLSPSVQICGGHDVPILAIECGWHGCIKNGEVL